MSMSDEQIETSRRQGRIEQRFSNIANMHHDDNPAPELIGLMRELFEYVKAIDQRLINRSEANRKDV